MIKEIVTAYVLGMDILNYSEITPQINKNIYNIYRNILEDDPKEIK